MQKLWMDIDISVSQTQVLFCFLVKWSGSLQGSDSLSRLTPMTGLFYKT